MASIYITDRAAMQQAALDFAARLYEEIDVVTLREACRNDRFLVEVVQSWRNPVASGLFMDHCASEHRTPIVGSSLGVFLGSPSPAPSLYGVLEVAACVTVCASVFAVAARPKPLEDFRNGLAQIRLLAARPKRFLANRRWGTRRSKAVKLIEDGTNSASQPSPKKSDVQESLNATTSQLISDVPRRKKRQSPDEALPSRASKRLRGDRCDLDPTLLQPSIKQKNIAVMIPQKPGTSPVSSNEGPAPSTNTSPTALKATASPTDDSWSSSSSQLTAVDTSSQYLIPDCFDDSAVLSRLSPGKLPKED